MKRKDDNGLLSLLIGTAAAAARPQVILPLDCDTLVPGAATTAVKPCVEELPAICTTILIPSYLLLLLLLLLLLPLWRR
jgi:hypothetical protein